MRTLLSTISVSPHLTSIFGEFAKLTPFKYIYHLNKHDPARISAGWTNETVFESEFVSAKSNEEIEAAPVLIEAMRDLDLIERRLKKNLPTVYMSERWFKPIGKLPGILRLLHPHYFRMAKRIAACMKHEKFRYLAQGVWAAMDMARICGIFSGKLSYIYRSPELEFEKVACGKIRGTDKMRLLGYFVSPSAKPRRMNNRRDVANVGVLKVLWVGRAGVAWKRVGDIERAVTLANKNLTSSLRLHQNSSPKITFTKLTGVSFAEVRAAMSSHDLYVLASDASEGWGAALNEALEEGMNALGTFEAGASASMLPRERLYHAGDIGALAKLLEAEYRGELPSCSIGEWSAKEGAKALKKFLEEEFDV